MIKQIAFVIAVLVSCPTLGFAADGDNQAGSADRATTVKSSKSNSSDRSSGTSTGATEATTVKGSKSNSSERSGNSAGGGAAEGTTVKSGKSNSSD